MSKTSGNASKTKKLIPGVANNSNHNRKSYQNISDSSSISSNRNSSAHSEEDVRVSGAYLRPQVNEDAPCQEQEEQVTKKLRAKVKELRHKLRILEESVDSKDYSLGTIAKEKDRAVGEIRRLERSNKLLRQQLSDERNHYLEEKEKFCQEMTKYKRKLQEVKSEAEGKKPAGRQPLISQSLKWQLSHERGDFVDGKPSTQLKKSNTQKSLGGTRRKSISQSNLSLIRKPTSVDSLHLYEGDDVSLQLAALRTENAKLRSIICERDEQNYELCLRFLRMKHYKNDIRDRFQELETEYLQVIANLMDKIDEARQEFNFIIDQKFKRPLHSTNAMYLQMVQKNSRMAFENASLRLENQCLKKELNKYINSNEYIRKNDSTTTMDDLEPKLIIEEEKTESNLKITKKNVNFNEVRTIYERYMTFKNSDTDSNYMSKTSTTGPSIGSLGDPKSNESIIEEEKSSQKSIQYPLQPDALPDEILKKIFKRIDTSSCQTVDTGRSKEHPQENKTQGESEKTEKKPPQDVFGKPEPTAPGQKPPLRQTDSSLAGRKQSPGGEPRVGKPEKRKGEQSFKTRLRYRVRCDWNLDRDSEGNSSLDFPLRKITLSGRKPAKTAEATRKRFQDSCGLQEKLEFSDLELPTSGVCNQSIVEPQSGEKPDVMEQKEKLGENIDIRQGRRRRSRSGLNLQAEMEEEMQHRKFGASSWGKEPELLPIHRNDKRNSSKNIQYKVKQEPETQQRKSEASKRFSHRLVSTSPEQLKSILTDPQMGSFRMTPVVVGHATPEAPPTFKYEDTNSELFLVLPSPKPQKSAVFSDNEPTETLTKETSKCESSLRKSPERTSDVRIPISSLPTSSSTMEILDSTVFERSNTMTRTLSAPGLLESNWLDPYMVCEMRDCGTNT